MTLTDLAVSNNYPEDIYNRDSGSYSCSSSIECSFADHCALADTSDDGECYVNCEPCPTPVGYLHQWISIR